MTPQRRLIVDIIHDENAHLTAEGIIKSVQNRMPGVNKSTIYRTLELLEELNCVFKSEVDDKFIYHHADEGHHHHIICSKCGKSIACKEDIFEPVEKFLRRRFGFQAEFKHVIVGGICKECSNERIR